MTMVEFDKPEAFPAEAAVAQEYGGKLEGAGFGEFGHRSRFNSASGTVNSATSVRVNSVEPDSV